jgi:ADP-dependent phosphofructokinase/glucokinase
MPKKEDTGSYIDFDNLTSDQLEKIKNSINIISAYYDEIDAVNESIKDTMESLVEKFNPDKESTKRLKATVKTVARTLSKDKAAEVVSNHSAIDVLLEKLGEVR